MLPVILSVSKDLGDYLRLAETLLDKMAETLAAAPSLVTRLRAEVRNWKFRRVNVGGFGLDREAPRFFLTSGSALLRHALAEAWKRFLRPAHFNGAIFFLDDLHHLPGPATEGIALILRDQFQAFGIEGLNYSVCFSARADYFSAIRSFAEPAVRFYHKFYLAPFTTDETTEYVKAVFEVHSEKSLHLSRWLQEKAHGHPYFLAFISRQLWASAQGSLPESPERFWPGIFEQLEREKFRSDLAQVSEKDIELLRTLARARGDEFIPRQFISRFQYEYFSRLTEKGLLNRTGRGRYKLYHPLFRLFLREGKP